MTILFGHPGGNPNSHNAALAHFEAGWLEAFCIPWMPSEAALRLLESIVPLRASVQRLRRRNFPALSRAPKMQGRFSEWARLVRRVWGNNDERLSYEANDWLMHTMARTSRRHRVTAIHSYEDCSLLQFIEAKRLGKACIYDMPIGYYPAWEQTQASLARAYTDWLPREGLAASPFVRPEQKREEMRLADMVLVASSFAAKTVHAFCPGKPVCLAPYGVDAQFWTPAISERSPGPLRYLYAGQLSLRKGTPILLDTWRRAALKDATLDLVGSWQLAMSKQKELPHGTRYLPPCSANELRERFRGADVLVFPSYFEGFGLVILEAMACGLPVIVSDATAGADIVSDDVGRVVVCGNADQLIDALRWFNAHRDELRVMRRAARKKAEEFDWTRYRDTVISAVADFA